MTDWRTEVRVELARTKKTRKTLALSAGVSTAFITNCLNGRRQATPRFARACETELGISAHHILRQEAATMHRRWLGKRLDELHALREGEER